jgi:hypothetical protein
MSRRSGQNGRIEKKGKALYARFWLDIPGQSKRTYKSVRICPVSGPGSLNKFERKRRVTSDPLVPNQILTVVELF